MVIHTDDLEQLKQQPWAQDRAEESEGEDDEGEDDGDYEAGDEGEEEVRVSQCPLGGWVWTASTRAAQHHPHGQAPPHNHHAGVVASCCRSGLVVQLHVQAHC